MEWISVKDRVPEMYKEVLVYTEKHGVQVDWIANKPVPYNLAMPIWWNYGELVTHWCYLPETPKESDTE